MAVSRDEPSYAEFTRSQLGQRFHKEIWAFIHNYTIHRFIASRVLPRFYRHDVHCSCDVSFLEIILFSKSIMIFLSVTGSPRRDWIETVRGSRLKNRVEGGKNRDVPRRLSTRRETPKGPKYWRRKNNDRSTIALRCQLHTEYRFSFRLRPFSLLVFLGCLSIISFRKWDFYWHHLVNFYC